MQTNASATNTSLTRRQFLRGASLFPGGRSWRCRRACWACAGPARPTRSSTWPASASAGRARTTLARWRARTSWRLCDVDQNHAGHIFKKYPKAKQFTDYRQMLDEMKEIDGVVIATPDHHHAFASMEAIKRGKHVYCEKPLTHSVWEARQVAKAAREAKVATQMGNQGQASEETRRLCELVWAGAIGQVHEAHIWTDRPSRGLFEEYWPQGLARPKDTPPVPATLDWDLWLGPAPLRPYNPAYLPFIWRGWWDFGTGALGDIGCHAMDPVFRALETGRAAQRPSRLHARERGDLPAGLDGHLPIPRALGGAAGQQLPRQGPQRRRGGRRGYAARASWSGMTAACARRGPMACPMASRWATTAACWWGRRGSSSATRFIPQSRAKDGRRDSQDHPALCRPLPGVDRGLQRRPGRGRRTSTGPGRSPSPCCWATWPCACNSGKT